MYKRIKQYIKKRIETKKRYATTQQRIADKIDMMLDKKIRTDWPEWDATDAAHPAWWRGETWSALKAAEMIKEIIAGNDNGEGVMNEPLETMRRSVMKLVEQIRRSAISSRLNKPLSGSLSDWVLPASLICEFCGDDVKYNHSIRCSVCSAANRINNGLPSTIGSRLNNENI